MCTLLQFDRFQQFDNFDRSHESHKDSGMLVLNFRLSLGLLQHHSPMCCMFRILQSATVNVQYYIQHAQIMIMFTSEGLLLALTVNS